MRHEQVLPSHGRVMHGIDSNPMWSASSRPSTRGLRWVDSHFSPVPRAKNQKRDLCFCFLPTPLSLSGNASEVQSKRACGFFVVPSLSLVANRRYPCHPFTPTFLCLSIRFFFSCWYWQETEPLRGCDEKGSILKMGVCTSFQKGPDSPMRCRLGLVSRAKRIFVSSPAKDRTLNGGSPVDRFGFQSSGFGMVSYWDQVLFICF